MPHSWSISDEVSAGLAPESLAQWWLLFDDALLADLVAKALQSNTTIATAQANLAQAWALRDVAAASLWPVAGASASAQRTTTGRDTSAKSFRAVLDASWEPDVFGANRSGLRAADASARASAANLGDVQVSIAAEVALAYLTLRGAQASLAIANENLASQEETFQITQWRVQAGLVSSLDVEQARTAVEQSRARVPVVQTAIVQTIHALGVLTGAVPTELGKILAVVAPVPQAPDGLALDIPAEALRHRADVRAAEHEVSAAYALVAQAEARRLPSFQLSGSVGVSALTLGSLTNGASVFSALLAGVSMPLFDGGALRAQVRAQEAALERATVAYRAVVLTALKDVEDSLIALRGDRERLLHLRGAAEAAVDAASLAQLRYRSGLVDFQAVLETQRAQLVTQETVANAMTDVGADHVRLYQALGGGWTDDGGQRAQGFTTRSVQPATGTPPP
jgi:NodT family efflux transporter outer membrane factor (OMF) lipoprotein